MQRMLVLTLLITAALLPAADAQIPSTGSLAGAVCTQTPWQWEGQECHEPLPGATVRVKGGALAAGVGATEKTETTDEAGRFKFQDLPEGQYDVTVTRDGFVRATDTVDVDGHVEKEYALEGEKIQVSGQVFDPDGKPVADAQVRGWGPDIYFHARTAADGRFSFDTVAGWHSVAVRAPGLRPADLHELLDGSGLQVELEPLPPPDLYISGVVRDKQGGAVEDAEVFFHQYAQEFGQFENWTRTDADGGYRLGAYVGDGSLRASKDGYTQQERWVYVESDTDQDFRILEVPEKTARLAGSVVDAVTGDPVRSVRVSIQSPEYGLRECSDGGGLVAIAVAEPYPGDAAYSPSKRYEAPGCAISVDGGSFTGNVTPGYAILEVRHDRWADCRETRSSDGRMERDCGPGYYTHTQTLRLQPDAANPVEVLLRPRPSADSTVSGYVLDEETGDALAGAHISFSNQERDGWGSAVTDEDGSYRIQLVSGYHRVSVSAEGHLRWQGVLDVRADRETPLDVRLTEGQDAHGGCCYAYEVAYAHDGGRATASSGSGPRPVSAPAMAEGSSGGSGEGSSYEDLGGGLGPYDAAKRQKALDPSSAGKDSPAPLALAVLVALAVAMRRR